MIWRIFFGIILLLLARGNLLARCDFSACPDRLQVCCTCDGFVAFSDEQATEHLCQNHASDHPELCGTSSSDDSTSGGGSDDALAESAREAGEAVGTAIREGIRWLFSPKAPAHDHQETDNTLNEEAEKARNYREESERRTRKEEARKALERDQEAERLANAEAEDAIRQAKEAREQAQEIERIDDDESKNIEEEDDDEDEEE